MLSTPSSRDTVLAKRLTFIVVLVMSLAVAIFLARQVFAYANFPFDADEANHALGGLQMAQALDDGDFGRFARHFYSRDFYPPGYDWIKALTFVVLGPSPVVARMVSVASLFLAVLVIYAVGLEFDEQWGWLVGFVAVLLTLTIQPLLINSGLVMMEAPGLLVSFALLYVYLRAIKRPSKWRLLATSILLTLTFLTKYTYGVVAVAVLLLMELSLLVPYANKSGEEIGRNGRASFYHRVRHRWLWLFGPFIVSMLLWFAGANKLTTFFGYTRPLADSEPWFTLQNMLFYPLSIALHDVPAPWFALVTAVSLLWALIQWRRFEVRLLLLYFLLGMAAIMLVNHPVSPRFIVTFVPAVHLLTGAMIAWLVRWQRTSKGAYTRFFLRLAAVCVALSLILSIPLIVERFAAIPSVMEAKVETSPGTEDLYSWIAEQTADAQQIYVINYWDQVSLPALSWHLATQSDGTSQRRVSGSLLQPATPARADALREDILGSNSTYLVLLEGGPWGSPFWPEYTDELQDILNPVARQRFTLEQYDSSNWLDRSYLTRPAWEQAKRDGRYTLEVNVIIFRLQGKDADA